MDFTFSSEQEQLADAVRRFIQTEYDFERRKGIVHSPEGISEPAWKQIAELGLLALPLPEEVGGFAGTAVDLYPVMRELGRGLFVEPYFATIFAARFLQRCGSAEQKARLADVADGTLKMAAALHERQSRYELYDVTTSATASGTGGYVLEGEKTVVIHGAQAGLLVVSARTTGVARDKEGISLFVVDPKAPGVTVNEYRTIDGLRAADIRFAGVTLAAGALLGPANAAWPMIEEVCDFGVALLCAESIGVMEVLNEQTIEYAKTRKQFGQPIGRFQALQHRMVEMFMQMEQARSLALLAAAHAESSDTRERVRAVAAAKVRCGLSGKTVGQEAVQIHGGMGVTNELPAAHYFKRLSMIELTLGDRDHHLARFVALMDEQAQAIPLKAAA